MLKKLEIIVIGRVQGIGYRAFTIRVAENLDIKGSVRNLSNGNVQVIAIGEEENMEQFIEKLKKGPTFSLVQKVKIREIETTEPYKDFRVEF
ncbi:MAG: acylphosphatase [Candidatus Cloacimonetes bacterium]|nr:acylphosphatase [Candidatus Cloacimonadota bacterium]